VAKGGGGGPGTLTKAFRLEGIKPSGGRGLSFREGGTTFNKGKEMGVSYLDKGSETGAGRRGAVGEAKGKFRGRRKESGSAPQEV